jgi:hypothetical protein
MNPLIPTAIDLGDFSISSATSLTDMLWFGGGLLMLMGLTAVTLWWQRRSQPDPFASGDS